MGNGRSRDCRFFVDRIPGDTDANSGGEEVLHNGRAPTWADDPSGGFFFAADTCGGRIQGGFGLRRLVQAGGKPLSKAEDVQLLRVEKGHVGITVELGEYCFISKLNRGT